MKPHFKTLGEIMITNTLVATENTTAYTVSVLLRAWLGIWVSQERGSYAQVIG